jgi:RNA polymerase sigma factor (sigma-70 family)
MPPPMPRHPAEPPGVAFERCFERNHAAIAAYCLRRSPSPEDAEDAATETFAVAWRRRDDLPPAPEDRLWLFGVARRVLANQARGSRRRDRLVHRLREQEPPPPAPDDEAGDGPAAVRRALAALRERDRELLLLIAWDGLTVAEAGRVLGLPAPAVSRRLYRTRRRLARHLSATAPDGTAAAPRPAVPSL